MNANFKVLTYLSPPVRGCAGKAFAMMEARLILGTMVQHVDLEVAEDFELDFLAQLSLSPRGGLPMNIKFVKELPSQAA